MVYDSFTSIAMVFNSFSLGFNILKRVPVQSDESLLLISKYHYDQNHETVLT
jgi:hypothetical protein